MHRSSRIIALSIAALAATNAQEGADSSGSRRRSRGLGTSQYESVSAEPLTFEVPEPAPANRERILSEADINGAEFDFLEEMQEYEEVNLINMEGDYYDEEQAFEALEDDGEDYDDMEEDVESVEELPFDGKAVDSTYVSKNGVDFVAEEEEAAEEPLEDAGEEEDIDMSEAGDYTHSSGSEDIGEALVFDEPIARKLRRVVPVEELKVRGKLDEKDEERYLAEKRSFNDESIPLFEPTLNENGEFDIEAEPEYLEELAVDDHSGRDLQSGCKWNQKQVKIQIITDNAGWEQRWELRRSNNALIAKGPPGATRYADNKQYLGALCLNPGQYVFKVFDAFKDGMCGTNTGKGLYRFYVNGAKRFTSPANCNVNWGLRSHTFKILPPASVPAPAPANVAGRGGCSNVKIQFKVDKYGKETTVMLQGNGVTQLKSNKDVVAYGTKTLTKCVPPGTYTLKLLDSDGICCQHGKGWYKMWVNGAMVVGGGYFIGSKTHTVKIGTNWQSRMSARAREWLNAHNSRRRKYNGGKGYVAMKWSTVLANNAKQYAETLGNSCNNGKLTHAKGIQNGENLAKNKGSGTWGGQYSAEKIMGRWVDNELNLSYPSNAHYTQVVWRATQYVGCGESVRNVGGNQYCRVQVCRYTRAGNCNVRNGNWRAEAWKDDTSCGNPCPSGGCFA